MKSGTWLSKGGRRGSGGHERLTVFPVVSTNAHPHMSRIPQFRDLGVIFSPPTFPCQNTHYTWSNMDGSVRLLKVAIESRQHTEAVECNVSVGLRVCGAAGTAANHHPPTCGPTNLSWKRNGCPFFFPHFFFFNMGEGSVGNRQGNGVHSKIDKELLAT